MLRRTARAVWRAPERAPLVGFLVGALTAIWDWLSYLGGRGQPFGLPEVVATAAQVYMLEILARQGELYALDHGVPTATEDVALAALWAAWGAGAFLVGAWRRSVLLRWVGILLAVAPIGSAVAARLAGESVSWAQLVIVVGLALVAIGVIATRPGQARPSPLR